MAKVLQARQIGRPMPTKCKHQVTVSFPALPMARFKLQATNSVFTRAGHTNKGVGRGLVTCMCWSGPGYMHVLVRAWLHACVGRVGATCLSNRYASKKGKERQMCGVTPQR